MFKNFMLTEAVWVLGAKVLSPAYSLKCEVTGVCTDTRKIEKGNLFIAIKGENFDGHKFVNEAIEKGACCAVVSDVSGLRNVKAPVLVVGDTVKSYGDLAGWYLRNFDVQRVALTGSAGKTTTREMIAKVLESKGKVLRNYANENNLIGVPKTIFELDEEHDFIVLELGTNQPGEIEALTDIAQPDCAVLLNALPVHLEGLKSLKGVIEEKAAILRGNDLQLAIVNYDDLGARSGTKGIEKDIVRVGSKDSYEMSISEIENFGDYVKFKVNDGNQFTLNLPGVHNVHNAVATIAVGTWAGVRIDEIAEILNKIQPEKMRNQHLNLGDNQIILDCYNANPASMKAAIDVLSDLNAKRKIAVLGDMFELGEFADMYHEQIGREISKSNVDILITAGELSKSMHKPASLKSGIISIKCCSTEEAGEELLKLIEPGDAVLLKASRSMKFEKIYEKLSSSKEILENKTA